MAWLSGQQYLWIGVASSVLSCLMCFAIVGPNSGAVGSIVLFFIASLVVTLPVFLFVSVVFMVLKSIGRAFGRHT